MELTPEQLREQLTTLKQSFDVASDLMKKSLKADIEATEKKLADSETKLTKTETDLKETQEKLAKVISAQDEMIAKGNERKVSGEIPTFGTLLAEAMKENEGQISDFAKGKTKSVQFQLKAVGDMSFSGNFSTASQSVATVRPGIISGPNRKVHVRDLVPQGTMDGSAFYYVKENGVGEGNPATVAEGGWKEQIDLDLIEAVAPAEYIAGWLRISKKMLADVKGMTSFLQNRLMEKLLRAEDNQLLNGNGTAPNISGITDAGNFTAATGTATIDFEQLVEGVSQMEDANEEVANGILVRPRNLYAMALYKGSGSGEYTQPGIITIDGQGQMRVLGVPVYASTAMASDKFIVGDWNLGAMLLTREPAVIEFFYEDGDNVRKNQVTVRVEERIAFPIFGDRYFIYGDFGNS
jgi:HK97 family phage major capsid protein